jgi:hypothetical protein
MKDLWLTPLPAADRSILLRASASKEHIDYDSFSEMHSKEIGVIGGTFGKMTCRYATTAITEKTPCLEKKYAK